jgi:hypothetical protein
MKNIEIVKRRVSGLFFNNFSIHKRRRNKIVAVEKKKNPTPNI